MIPNESVTWFLSRFWGISENDSPVKDLYLLYLGQADCEATAIDYDFAIKTCESILVARAEGHVKLPRRIHLRLDEVGGSMFVAPMHIQNKHSVLGLLWMTVLKQPSPSPLPEAFGFYFLHEPTTGAPLAILDCGLFDRMGTAATTAVAAKYLAWADSSRIAVVGTGRIGRSVATALDKVMAQSSDLRLYDVNVDVANACAEEIRPLVKADVKVVETAHDAIVDADVIASATTSREPIVNHTWLKKGCFYSQIGISCEAEPAVVSNSNKIVVLDWAENKNQGSSTLAQMHSRGDFDEKEIYADLTEIVNGEKPGRETAEEMIYFSPLGTAGTSIALANHVYETAKRQGLGQVVKIS